MATRSRPFDLTLPADDAALAVNVPAERLLDRLKPEMPGFMARILAEMTEGPIPTYRSPRLVEDDPGFLGSLLVGDQGMSLRIANDAESHRFGPLPGHFGVFFVVSYTGDVSDLTILVPVDLDGRPDHEAWLKCPDRGSEPNLPRRETFGSRKMPSTAVFDLLEFLVEQGLAHRQRYLVPGPQLTPGVYELVPGPTGIGPSTSPEDDPSHRLWSRLLIQFEPSYRRSVEAHHPRTIPMVWPPELHQYPTGLFAHLRLRGTYVALTVNRVPPDTDSLAPLAEIRVSFHTRRVEISSLTIRLVIDAHGAPMEVLSCRGLTARGRTIHDTGASPASEETHADTVAGFTAYLSDRIIGHHQAISHEESMTGSVIDYVDEPPRFGQRPPHRKGVHPALTGSRRSWKRAGEQTPTGWPRRRAADQTGAR